MRLSLAEACDFHSYQCNYEQAHNQPSIYLCPFYPVISECYQVLGHNERILDYETLQVWKSMIKIFPK